MRITVRAELSKTRHQYFTFAIIASVCRILSYLNERLSRNEVLHGNSPVISLEASSENRRSSNNAKPFLPTVQISRRIRQIFRPRFTWRPYMLRAYFDTYLLIAESKGLIAHDFRVFFMGHVGSIEATYTTNKSMLPEKSLDAMRESFARVEKYLYIETIKEDKFTKAKQNVHTLIQNISQKQLGQY